MGLLGSLFGKKPPAAPGTYYIACGDLVGDPFIVRRKADDKRFGPNFTSMVEAGKYLDSLEGGPPYRYPSGPV